MSDPYAALDYPDSIETPSRTPADLTSKLLVFGLFVAMVVLAGYAEMQAIGDAFNVGIEVTND